MDLSNLDLNMILVIAVGGVLLFLLIKLIGKPIKKVFKLLLHAVFGYAMLFFVNFFFGSETFYLELNLANCIVAGVGGVPGVLLLIAYKLFFV